MTGRFPTGRLPYEVAISEGALGGNPQSVPAQFFPRVKAGLFRV